MNISKKHFILLALGLLFIIIIVFLRSNLIWHSNINKHMEKIYGEPITIKKDENFSYKGRNYRIILGASKDKEDDVYLKCFEEVLNGTFYKGAYGASKGESNLLYGEVLNFVNDGTDDGFVIIYGYNKGFKANEFNVKLSDNGKLISQNIDNEEYFVYTYTDIVYPFVIFKDKNNNDVKLESD